MVRYRPSPFRLKSNLKNNLSWVGAGVRDVGLKRLSKYLFRDDEFRGQDLWKNLQLPQSVLSVQCTLSRWISTLEWFFLYLGEPQNASVGKQPQTVQRLQPRRRHCSCDILYRIRCNQRFPRLLLQTPQWSSLSVYILGNLSMLPLDVLPLLQGCWDQLKTSKQKFRVRDFQISGISAAVHDVPTIPLLIESAPVRHFISSLRLLIVLILYLKCWWFKISFSVGKHAITSAENTINFLGFGR